MSYYTDQNHIVVKRHKMIMCFNIMKVAFLLLVCWFLYTITDVIKDRTSSDAFDALISLDFFIIFCLIHYAFFILTSLLIKYYNNVIIISDNSIVSVNCSLLLKDDVEVIDCHRISKVDAFTRGFLPNILGYGDITIEQQQNEVKTFHYIPKPYVILEIIKKQRESLLNANNNNGTNNVTKN